MTAVSLLAIAAILLDDPPINYARDVKPLLARHCVSCHGANKPRAGLRLDTAAGARHGGKRGSAIVPGRSDESLLYLAVLVDQGKERMPLRRPPLSSQEIALLKRWIDQGASAPTDEAPSEPPPHWAFVTPTGTAPPLVRDVAWCRNPIDRFILERLEREQIAPSPEADRATLIRRVNLDLVGLPPTPEAVRSFVNDPRPDAYERLVDNLLSSPHYGERWARPWLDLARYADSNGYSIDAPRTIWPYRDWVIESLNADMPYDRFGTLQLAGDLVENQSIEYLVATGFHRNTPINQEGGIDREQFRIESVIDRTNTTATVFLGLTMACAQCHDHKYDPLTQQEYYQMFAFFNNCDEPEIHVVGPELVARRHAVEAEVEAYLDRIWNSLVSIRQAVKEWELSLDMAGRQKQSQEVREAFDVPFDQRKPDKQRLVFAAFVEQAEKGAEYKAEVDRIRVRAPRIVTSLALRERVEQPRATHIFIQGDFTRLGKLVKPGVPGVLPEIVVDGVRPTRLDLAHWLFEQSNPLPSRVAVNRIWQHHFGRGLVATENDFGTQGSPPTHPELLDWLAMEFARGGYSQKHMHRLMVTSATYRQSSRARDELHSVDPSNQLLARQSRLRLDAELLRDSALSVSGLLTKTIGGPSVFPPQPEGVTSLGQMRREWKTDTGPNRYRRGLYTYLWRATPHPLLSVFDAPDPARSCTRRERSNTPLQALILLNDQAFLECANALAQRVLDETASDDNARIDQMFMLCMCRTPNPTERLQLLQLLREFRARSGSTVREAWFNVARVLLNVDEFLSRE